MYLPPEDMEKLVRGTNADLDERKLIAKVAYKMAVTGYPGMQHQPEIRYAEAVANFRAAGLHPTWFFIPPPAGASYHVIEVLILSRVETLTPDQMALLETTGIVLA